jgi:hypothetical protein
LNFPEHFLSGTSKNSIFSQQTEAIIRGVVSGAADYRNEPSRRNHQVCGGQCSRPLQ